MSATRSSSNANGKRRIATSGGDVAVLDVGAPEAPAVLFVHGFPTSSFLWRAFVPMLPPAMRAIAPDLVGAGDSDKPEASPLDIRAQAHYLAEVLDALELDRVAIVGHSHGGGIAQLLALDGRAASLVLMDSIAFDAWPSEPMRELQRIVARGDATIDSVIASAFDIGMAHRARLPGQAVAEYQRPFRVDDGRAAFARWAASIDGAGLDGRDDELAALEIPVFLVWGEDDPFAPPEIADRLSELLPASSLALLPGCKHFLPEDAPQAVAPLLYEYLRSAYAKLPHEHRAEPTIIELGRRVSKE